MEIPLTGPQKEFVLSKAPRPAIIGGLGSGKSRGGTMRLIYQMSLDAGCSGAYNINKSDYRISIAGLGDIIFRSYDNPNRIIAYEVAHSICDELDTLPIEKASEVWRKINERNREKINNTYSFGMGTSPDHGFNLLAYQ